MHHRRYRPQWCTVIELEPDSREKVPILRHGTRDPCDALWPASGQNSSDTVARPRARISISTPSVDSYVEVRAGSFADDAIYIESQRSRRDLSVLVLLDISGSPASRAGRVASSTTTSCLLRPTSPAHCTRSGIAWPCYGFRSQGRSAVHIFPVKRFDEGISTLTDGRLGGLGPGGFTRLGAAIRHGASTLEREGGTGRRLLVVLSDGFAYDHGYEGSYGEADARRALSEARRRGIGCLCLSIASTTDAEALRRVFGTAAYAALGTADDMAGVIAPLFRAALGTAEFQRRRSERVTRSTERLSMERSTRT